MSRLSAGASKAHSKTKAVFCLQSFGMKFGHAANVYVGYLMI